MSFIAKKVGRNLFKGQAAAIEPVDPHYETYQDASGRTRSRKRQMPEGLSKKDQRILRSVRRRAHYLDKGFSICGFRFGWTAIFGLIPFLGDIIGFLLSYFLVLRKCRQADLPPSLSSRMAFNQMVGSGIGIVPLVGDIMLAVWKANSRNAILLEEYLIARSKTGASAESAAQTALSSSAISGKTGERPGASEFSGEYAGGSAEGSPGTMTPVGGAGAGGSMATRTTGTTPKVEQQKKRYGWGQGTTKSEDQRPLTQASVANAQAARTT